MAEVTINAGPVRLAGSLQVPQQPRALIVFAHGSGSSRSSPRNVQVAQDLNSRGFATLLFDLLTETEAADRARVFDIPLLAGRLTAATTWTRGQESCHGLRVGYFGASTGAAAALMSAASDPFIYAVVSRGGRPDLAGVDLRSVRAATLLLIGGDDTQVIRLNQDAYPGLRCVKDLVLIPGASHLFEEPGCMEEVSRLAGDWFQRHLS